MKKQAASAVRCPIKFERTYEAPVEDLWELWTTKEGFESWWGPEGFRVEVHRLDPRVGGELLYVMIAVTAEQIEVLNGMQRPASTETRGTFVEIAPFKRLKIRHLIDFIPGVEPYEHDLLVEFVPEATRVRMTITVDPHYNEEHTRLSSLGLESQLMNVPAALAARAARRQQ